MRRRTTLDPAVAAELEELDAALAGERQDPEIALIAAEARAAAPPLPLALEQRLEAAARNGFAKPPRARGIRPGRLAPALGLAGAAAVAVVIGVSASGGGSDTGSSSSGAPETFSVQAAKDGAGASSVAPSAARGTAVPAPSEAADVAASPATPRRVQRNADLILATPAAKLEETSDAVGRTVDRLGGYVQRSDVSAGGARGQATFDLRVPTDRLDEALATLSRLGHVRSRTQQSEDITSRFTSASSRLHDARSERQALLRALAKATSSQEIASLHARLDIARSRIAAAKGDLAAARRAAGLARVSVTVVGVAGEQGAAGGKDDGSWTPRRALHDAVHLLSVAAGVAIVALAAAIPALLLGLLLLLAWRLRRRREREMALGGGRAAV